MRLKRRLRRRGRDRREVEGGGGARGHARGVEAVVREQVLPAADLVDERCRGTRRAATRPHAGLGRDLGDGAAEAADDAVLLEREDRAGPRERGEDRAGVERLDGAEVQDAASMPPRASSSAGAERLGEDRPGRRERDVGAVAQRGRPADREAAARRAAAPARRSCPGAGRPGRRARGRPRSPAAASLGSHGREHGHVGQRAHGGDVVDRVVGEPEVAVGDAAADAHSFTSAAPAATSTRTWSWAREVMNGAIV